MALLNSKSQLQIPIPALLIKICISFLLLLNVKSQLPQFPDFETFNFGYSSFDQNNANIFLLGNASVSGGVLRLSKTGTLVGRALLQTPVHLWDKASGNLSDFNAGFSFVVNPPSASSLRGHGFAFFLAGEQFLDIPNNSSGGYLGLFNPATAFDPTKNQILAFEFDTFTNAWDPTFPHIGIDVGSIKSAATAAWPRDSVPGNAVGSASIKYDSLSKTLTLFMSYNGYGKNATVSYMVDLRTVLPEYVWVGFSAATDLAVDETHDVLNFGFGAGM